MALKFPERGPLNLPALAEEWLEVWDRENTFQQSVDRRPADKPYVFFEGPPSANGKPGIHHVMARAIKDIFCRFQTLKGHRVERKAGWDTHGLPVELGVEKELGITKEDIGTKLTVEEYNDACRKTVMRYTSEWNELTRQMGYWVDMDAPYVTYHTKYMESVWWLLAQLHGKGMLYKGYTIQPYSPMAGTGLSSHELNQPGTYRDVKDTTIVAQFHATADSRAACQGRRGRRRPVCRFPCVDDHALDAPVQHGPHRRSRHRVCVGEDLEPVHRGTRVRCPGRSVGREAVWRQEGARSPGGGHAPGSRSGGDALRGASRLGRPSR
jgi:isoleucyl-tRNA synthetase